MDRALPENSVVDPGTNDFSSGKGSDLSAEGLVKMEAGAFEIHQGR